VRGDGRRLVGLLRHAATRAGEVARGVLDGWDHGDVVRTARRSVHVLRRVDRATGYRARLVVGAHLAAIDGLLDRGAYDEALAAAEDVLADCVTLGPAGAEVVARAHGERARCLARLDRLDESIDEFTSSLEASAAPPASHGEGWRLSVRYSLALARRDAGELEASTAELRALVPAMATTFGEHSSWRVSAVTELATNVALDGDVETAIEMVRAELPSTTVHRGPLSREALTLRSKIARWTLAEDEDPLRGRRLAAATLVDFTRAGLSTCAEAFELRFVFADALVEGGEVDYGIAQLTSLLEDLRDSRWAASDFTEVVTTELAQWRDVQRGGATRD
jgi:hypothetical protein